MSSQGPLKGERYEGGVRSEGERRGGLLVLLVACARRRPNRPYGPCCRASMLVLPLQ